MKGRLILLSACSVSSPLSEASGAIREIGRLEKATGGAIDGRVLKRSSWKGLEGVRFTAQGAGKVYEATSSQEGWFHFDVPAGHYKVTTEAPRVLPYDLSYDDPTSFEVPQGGCGLIQFVAEGQ